MPVTLKVSCKIINFIFFAPYYAQRRLEGCVFFFVVFFKYGLSFYIGNEDFCIEVAIIMTSKLATLL